MTSNVATSEAISLEVNQLDVKKFEGRRQVKCFAETLEDSDIHVEDLQEQVDCFYNPIVVLTQKLELLTMQRDEVVDRIQTILNLRVSVLHAQDTTNSHLTNLERQTEACTVRGTELEAKSRRMYKKQCVNYCRFLFL